MNFPTDDFVVVGEGNFAFGERLMSRRFVHCVAIVLRGERGALLVHNQPLQTTFPTPDEVRAAIGDVTCGACILGRHHLSRGTIHFLATLGVPLPNDKVPDLAADAIPYLHIDADCFDVSYDFAQDALSVRDASAGKILLSNRRITKK